MNDHVGSLSYPGNGNGNLSLVGQLVLVVDVATGWAKYKAIVDQRLLLVGVATAGPNSQGRGTDAGEPVVSMNDP